jgi:hypothetical protein
MDSHNVRHLLDLIKQQNAGLTQLLAERDQLRAEDAFVSWANGGDDALGTLQRLYSDPKTKEENKIKACGLALPFEKAKPAAVSVVIDFKARVKAARLKAEAADKARWALEDAAKAKVIEHEPLDLDGPIAKTFLGKADDEGPDSAA